MRRESSYSSTSNLCCAWNGVYGRAAVLSKNVVTKTNYWRPKQDGCAVLYQKCITKETM